MTDAVETYLALPVGASFTLRGRSYTTRVGGPGGCFSSYADGHISAPVWNDKGQPTLVTIRPTHTLTVT